MSDKTPKDPTVTGSGDTDFGHIEARVNRATGEVHLLLTPAKGEPVEITGTFTREVYTTQVNGKEYGNTSVVLNAVGYAADGNLSKKDLGNLAGWALQAGEGVRKLQQR